MNRIDAQSGTGLCPPRDDLAAFNRGELTDPALEALANHVSDCTECASTLEALRGEDTAGSSLREALQGPPVAEPGYEALEAQVRAMLPDLSVTAVKTAGPAEAAPPPDQAEWPLPRAFGRHYDLLEKLGRGGVGVVYKARQRGLNRLVALKHLRAGPHAEREERTRFQTEGEALARVRHPNVVQVYEVGEHEGQPYLTMELVAGGSLARRLARGPLPPREAAELVRVVALAVEAIHRAGVVHRDLKPGNVLLEADGTPKVSDFGLAKLLDAEAEHTLTGAVLGTASYMAPEQAGGRSRHVGPAADVWALGTILYECLTGRRPFQGPSRAATLDLVQKQEPARPGRCRPVCPDLEAVCLKCLEKSPAKRYASAAALADDLGRWLEGKPTLARPLGWAGRAWRSLAGRRWWAGVMALALLGGLAAGAGWALHDPDRAVKQAEAGLTRGEKVTLIGESGGPAWWRWCAGGPVSQAAVGPDGTFAVQAADSLALVEVLRQPRPARFRLRAEVWHRDGATSGEVGLYFAQATYLSAGGPVHHYGALTYNDVHDEAAKWRRIHEEVRERFRKAGSPVPDLTAPKGNQAMLGPRLYPGAEPPGEMKLARHEAYFKPHGVGGGWRQLVVEVTPDGVAGSFDGRPIRHRPAAEWEGAAADFLAGARRSQPNALYALGPDPSYSPGGGVGLYVSRGSASFRNVAVEPLGPPN